MSVCVRAPKAPACPQPEKSVGRERTKNATRQEKRREEERTDSDLAFLACLSLIIASVSRIFLSFSGEYKELENERMREREKSH